MTDLVKRLRASVANEPNTLQRKLALGYNAAARLIERAEDEGIVSRPDHVGKREVLTTAPQSQ